MLLSPELTAEEAKHVVGIQAHVWTEYISNIAYAEYMTYPRDLALSEVSWSTKESKKLSRFQEAPNGPSPFYGRFENKLFEGFFKPALKASL